MYEKLKKVLAEKKITVKDLCERIGITEGGFYLTVKNNSFKVATLELISEELDIPMTYWFVDENSPVVGLEEMDKFQVQKITYLHEKVFDLKEQNKLLKRIIEGQENTIKLLGEKKEQAK